MKHFSRRSLLLGASLLALSRANAGINNPGSASSQPIIPGFAGGVTETNLDHAGAGGQFKFANFVKTGTGFAYNSNPTDPAAPRVPILELDANGYPTSIPAGTGAINTLVLVPNSVQYAGTWVVKFDGTGTLQISGPGINVTNSTGRATFTNPTDVSAGGTRITLFIQSTAASPNHLKNLRMCQLADEAGVDAGTKVFFSDFLNLMKSVKIGAYRALGWGGAVDGSNTSLLATWAQRRPTTYVTYEGDRFYRPEWYGGTTTNSGTDYSLAYGGFTLTDKVAVNLQFNVSAVNTNIIKLNYANTSGAAINIAWPTHNLAVGNVVMFGDTPSDSFGTPPAPLLSAVSYFVNNVIDANNFTVSTTSGGSSVLASANGSGTMAAVAIHRININGTGFVPMTNLSYPFTENIGFSLDGPKAPSGQQGVSTLVYDATTHWFRLSPGGMVNGGPPEIFIDFCAAVGAMPWLVAPFLTMTTGAGAGTTDYMAKWANYATTTYPWMKPLIEPPNETWNGGTAAGLSTFYATFLSQVLWGTPGVFFADKINQAYGKWTSDLGQAISTQYGNDRTKYSMICAAAAVNFNGNAGLGVLNRLQAAVYVGAGGSPAYLWADRVCIANYYSPTERFTVQEVIDAFNYSVTNAGNPTAQAAIANSYAASADTGTNSAYNLTWNLTNYTNLKAWAQGMPGGNTIKGVVSYEGGWSPDYIGGNWSTGMTGATAANPCVVTLNTANGTGNPEFGGIAGNPAAVGMAVSISGVSGMTQLNNPPNQNNGCTFTNTVASVSSSNSLKAGQGFIFSGASLPPNVTAGTAYYVLATGLSNSAFQFATTPGGTAVVPNANGTGTLTSDVCAFSSGSASISVGNTLLVNQCVTFTSSPPSPFQINTTYYVLATGLSGNSIQLSATKGGTALVAGANASGVNLQEGWSVSGVGASTISLDVDSSAFGAYTSGGAATWMNSVTYSNTLRLAGGNSSENGTLLTKWYGLYAGLASAGFVAEFPSNFLLIGNGTVWYVLQPDIYGALTPQWNAIVAANH